MTSAATLLSASPFVTNGRVPWPLVLGAVPLVGAVAVALVPSRRPALAKQVALVASLVTFALAVVMFVQFRTAMPADGSMFQFVTNLTWIPQFGVRFALGVDGVGLALIVLVTFLVPVVVVAGWNDDRPIGGGIRRGGSARTFMALLLSLETLLVGVFAATDVFLFYVFFESMLIPMYFLIGSFGGEKRSYAAVKFLLYSLLGGLLMLAAVIGLYVVSASQLPDGGTFDYVTLVNTLKISRGVQDALFLGFFIAFAIKAPLFPFHTWLPDAGAEAPTGAAVLLVGVLDKVGTFGFLRYAIGLFPDAAKTFAPVVLVLAVIGILYGALVAMAQRDIKRLVSYTSVAHFGFIALGTFALTTQGVSGAVLYMVNHGLSTGALFLLVGFLVERGRTKTISSYGGIGKVAPVLAGCLLLAGLSSLALPGLSSFVSEFLVLVGTFTRYRVAAILGTTGIVLAALYILIMYQRTMQGPLLQPEGMTGGDLTLREKAAVVPVLVLVVALGVYPKPLLDRVNPTVTSILQHAGTSDPAPSGVAAAGR